MKKQAREKRMTGRGIYSSLRDVETEKWARGAILHLSPDGSARSWLFRDMDRQSLVVLPDVRQVEEFSTNWLGLFGASPVTLSELPLDTQSLRNTALGVYRGEEFRRWMNDGGVLASSPGALLAPLIFGGGTLELPGKTGTDRSTLLDWLQKRGYERVDLVWAPGQYAPRGVIVDLYDPGYALPLRFEFFDEDIESIRSFHPDTQKSVASLDSIVIHGLDAERSLSCLSLLPKDCHVVLFEPSSIENQAERYRWLWEDIRDSAGAPPLPDWNSILIGLAGYPRLRVTKKAENADGKFVAEGVPVFRGDIEKAKWSIHVWRNQGYSVTLVTSSPTLFEGGDVSASLKGDFVLRRGALTEGFVDSSDACVWLSDKELTGRVDVLASKAWSNQPVEWKDSLSAGQLVVHEEYGVAVFRGTETVRTSSGSMDAIILEFAGGERLLVPFMQMYSVTPMQIHEGEEIPLDSLRGVRWKKALKKTKERAEHEARELLTLYAQRELCKGEKFPPPTELYHAFVDAFPYVETKDQLRAIDDVLSDLENPVPMDRLIVGDVGFGKTEVAIRAAFRAVEAGRQVAVLVPTTILAQQHYVSFQSRMAGFPVRVATLSRFVPASQQKDTVDAIRRGEVDIVIGTQRLLQKDVAFRNLGLLVIDEEHRFGVMHKERLKHARKDINVLTLSATPIPRTLSMSLRGIRDISTINTPPHRRRPVLTVTTPWKNETMLRAVKRELSRGGQVFFVVNRISRIEEKKRYLESVFPEARTVVAHGQMPERELEQTMTDFYNGAYDILLCTTIIESGLDVARANTLIIDDAQELGLAQMYQLRGRIGRREQEAYAFFFYPEHALLRQETTERLEAIASFSEIGAGFGLARQDLEIRGGGDILGTSQHGKHDRSGFQFYMKTLEDEIARLRGEDKKFIRIDADLPAGIPSSYIPQESVRITLFRRFLKEDDPKEFRALLDEILDRFGPVPEELRVLWGMTLIRNAGARAGIDAFRATKKESVLTGHSPTVFSLLRTKKRWIVLEDKAVGPGGAPAIADVVEALCSDPASGRVVAIGE